MTCDLLDGVCINCGGDGSRKCRAELPLAELYAMYFGAAPVRAVRLTNLQARALADAGEAGWQVSLAACVHRGAETRRVKCDDCKKSTTIKVFACELFSECSIAKKLPGIACCATCGDYRSPAAAVESPAED